MALGHNTVSLAEAGFHASVLKEGLIAKGKEWIALLKNKNVKGNCDFGILGVTSPRLQSYKIRLIIMFKVSVPCDQILVFLTVVFELEH